MLYVISVCLCVLLLIVNVQFKRNIIMINDKHKFVIFFYHLKLTKRQPCSHTCICSYAFFQPSESLSLSTLCSHCDLKVCFLLLLNRKH